VGVLAHDTNGHKGLNYMVTQTRFSSAVVSQLAHEKLW